MQVNDDQANDSPDGAIISTFFDKMKEVNNVQIFHEC